MFQFIQMRVNSHVDVPAPTAGQELAKYGFAQPKANQFSGDEELDTIGLNKVQAMDKSLRKFKKEADAAPADDLPE